MHSGTELHVRRLAVLPALWIAFFSAIAGAMSAAMMIITLASEHYGEAIVAGVCMVVFFGLAVVLFTAMPRIADEHTRTIEARRDHAVYRARYPLPGAGQERSTR